QGIWHRLRRSLDPIGDARSLGVTVGDGCLFGSQINWGSEPYLVILGNHVRLTDEIVFLTHDGGLWIARDRHPKAALIKPIVIEDNCFIGIRSILLPGVTIGRNSVVGAGSIVTRSVPPNSVVAGVPARIVRTSDGYIERTLPESVPTKGLGPRRLRQY